MNKQQRIDSQLCEDKQSNGEDMDCTECSCSVCIAQQPNNYKMGFKKAIYLVETEIEKTENIAHKIVLESLLEILQSEIDNVA